MQDKQKFALAVNMYQMTLTLSLLNSEASSTKKLGAELLHALSISNEVTAVVIQERANQQGDSHYSVVFLDGADDYMHVVSD